MPNDRSATVYEREAPAPSVIDHALARTQQRVFWLDDVARPDFPVLTSALDVDLAVVGGGYLGLWTAVLAKRRDPDARVVVLEAERLGWAASGRNGGFCEASITHGETNGRSRWPAEYGELERLGQANLEAMQHDVDQLGLDCEWERTGTLEVAVEPYQVAGLEAGSGAGHDAGSDPLLDAEQVRAEINSPIFLAGRWHREDTALVHPGRLVVGLARAAAEAGVEIFEHVPVSAVRRRGSGLVLDVGGVEITAAQAVLATNVFDSLLVRNRWMTVPVYDYVLVTEPLSADQRAAIGWANRQGLTDVANQFHYARLTADQRILYGGYDAIYPPGGRLDPQQEQRPESFRRLASHFFTTFPQLAGLRFSHRWAGAIDTCTRFAACYGLAHGGRVAYATGFTGLGVGATRFAAEVVLDLLAGLDTERTRLELVRERPLPFPPEPFAGVGINLARWSLDRADHREGHRNLFLRGLDRVGLGFDS